MDRLVEIKVKYGTATADSKFIGVVGDANITEMRVTFASDWTGFTKTLYMWDARGENPVAIVLGTNLLEDILVDGVYIVPIPAEPLAYSGTNVVAVFEGTKTVDDVTTVQRTSNLKFTVLEGSVADDADAPVDVTPTQAAQLQAEIDTILPTLQADVTAAQTAKTAAELAETNAEAAMTAALGYRDAANAAKFAANAAKDGAAASYGLANIAKDAALAAQTAAETAETNAQAAQAAIEAMTASATGLSAGAAPTVTKTTVEGVVNLAFGIPKGDKGDKGDTGATGPQGYSIGTVYKKSGTGTAGTTDTYGVKINDAGSTEVGTFTVYNGADGDGAGDMLATTYDTNADGKVNAADDADKLGGQLPAHYATAGDLTAHTGSTSNPHGVTAAQAGAVPTTRTVNGKALSSNITLTNTDVGAAAASHTHAATEVSIADSGGHFTATDVEGALAELFTSGSNGKAALETAIETKGGTVDKADAVATFAELEDGLNSIPTGSGTYQSKTVTPNAAGQTVTPDAGYDALSQVTINGDADLIADNIKKDVTIYGVTGTLSGGNQLLNLSFFTVVSPNIATFTLT